MPWSKTTLDDRGSQLSSWTVSFVGRVLRLSRLEIEDAYIRRDTGILCHSFVKLYRPREAPAEPCPGDSGFEGQILA